jgi:hypothetical protein
MLTTFVESLAYFFFTTRAKLVFLCLRESMVRIPTTTLQWRNDCVVVVGTVDANRCSSSMHTTRNTRNTHTHYDRLELRRLGGLWEEALSHSVCYNSSSIYRQIKHTAFGGVAWSRTRYICSSTIVLYGSHSETNQRRDHCPETDPLYSVFPSWCCILLPLEPM